MRIERREPLGPRGRSSRCALSLALLIVPGLFAVARPIAADLVVLAEGSVIKVDDYRRRGDRVELLLPSGGSLELPLIRIERIVADEIEPAEDTQPLFGLSDVPMGFLESHRAANIPFGDLIYETARRYDINPDLVGAIVRAESAFDPNAVSSKGASGLLQLMPATASRFGLQPDQIFDPSRNLEAGVRYLSWLRDRFDGDTTLVLAGYNAGEVNVDRYDGVPPFRETQTYIRRVYDWLATESVELGRE
ncbi:MAG: lytic transglycosylase domain-containing protein [Acidobacteriota bacterium]